MTAQPSPRHGPIEQHQRFLAVAELVLSSAPLDQVISEALVLLQAAVEFDAAAFYCWDERHRTLQQAVVLAAKPHASSVLFVPPTAGDLLNQVAAGQQPPIRSRIDGTGTHEIVVPVLARGVLLGAFSIRRYGGAFTESELDLVTGWVGHASVAIENARLLRQMRQSEKQYRSLFDACLESQKVPRRGRASCACHPCSLCLASSLASLADR